MADDELNVPPPEPLRFNIDEPALLDDDMVEILLLEEASPGNTTPLVKFGHATNVSLLFCLRLQACCANPATWEACRVSMAAYQR